MALIATVSAVIRHTLTKALDLSTPQDKLERAYTQEFAAGTGADQVDVIFHDKRTLAGGADETLDLIGGGLVNPLGGVVAFAKIRAIVIKNTSTTKTFTVGNAAAPVLLFGTAAHTVNIPPDGVLVLTNPDTGWPVTGGSADGIKIANDAGVAADYEIWIVGTSA